MPAAPASLRCAGEVDRGVRLQPGRAAPAVRRRAGGSGGPRLPALARCPPPHGGRGFPTAPRLGVGGAAPRRGRGRGVGRCWWGSGNLGV